MKLAFFFECSNGIKKTPVCIFKICWCTLWEWFLVVNEKSIIVFSSKQDVNPGTGIKAELRSADVTIWCTRFSLFGPINLIAFILVFIISLSIVVVWINLLEVVPVDGVIYWLATRSLGGIICVTQYGAWYGLGIESGDPILDFLVSMCVCTVIKSLSSK